VGKAKNIQVKPISSKDANKIIKRLHYSGKVVNNSKIHFGVFLNGKCGGALQFGPSLDKRKIMSLVKGTGWNEFVELNRMALADWLPRNGESRSISLSMKMFKNHYPWLKWVVSFADATQCGDGTIYRASNFVLTGIKQNNQIWEAPTGQVFSRTSLNDGRSKKQQTQVMQIASRTTLTKGSHIKDNGASSMKAYIEAGWTPKQGFQLRYIYFLHPKEKENLTVPIIPFSKIDEMNAGMYKGEKKHAAEAGDGSDQDHSGGSTPTQPLHDEANHAS